jgi:putative glutamine amidotransferase
MRRPIIGITADSRDDKPSRYDSSGDYAKSVERAGGLPVILPFRTDLALVPEFVDALDGVLFTGGNDLDPLYTASRGTRTPSRSTKTASGSNWP